MGESEAVVRAVASGARTRRVVLAPEAIAWCAVVPCALVVTAAIVWLGPLVGRIVTGGDGVVFWAGAWVEPEPTEHGRFLVALLGPPLLAGVVLVGARRRVQMQPAMARVLAHTGQLALGAFLVTCLLAQSDVVVHAMPARFPHGRFFTPATLLAAAAVALVATLPPRRANVRRALAPLLRETRGRRLACFGVAALATATWLLTGVNSDATIGRALANNLLPWTWDESFAVLDGRTPLVDFHTQYAQLWPYLGAALMRLIGTSLIAWSIAMACASTLTALALYAVLRRVVRSSLAALALYLPTMATGFFIFEGTLANRFSPAGNFNLWPTRYSGPYVLAWLTARHLDGLAPRRRRLLFLCGGLVLVNNTEFGAGAFGGTLLALLCAAPTRSRREVARVAVDAALGLAAAVAAVVLLTLARTGSLPDPGLLSEFPRIYLQGWTLFPMPVIGLHLALYATFAAALAVAAVRWANAAEDTLLTAMLAWCGTFGLGAGVYYAGRSDSLNLVALFSPWALSLALLTVVAVRTLAARGWERPAFPELAVLFGFGLAVASLVQAPTPWSQVARLRDTAAVPIFKRPDVERFVAERAGPGRRVAIVAPLGHRIAYDLHLTNVSPYSGLEAMPTVAQYQTVVATVRAAHLDRLFVGTYDKTAGRIEPNVIGGFEQAGFTAHRGPGGLVELRREP